MKTIIETQVLPIKSAVGIITDTTFTILLKAFSNEPQIQLTSQDVISFLKVYQAAYPILYKLSFQENVGEKKLSISNDDGETFPLILTWKEVYELEQHEADLVINNNLS